MKLPDATVGRAARAQFELLDAPELWSGLTDETRDSWRRTTRAALEAALSECATAAVSKSRARVAGRHGSIRHSMLPASLIGKRVALVVLDD